ncbi:hypothetical protein AB0M43_09845 [Longispora sp. NPDC051575]|uniref:hypothetical protein n=1 Tax=Longispora sp. NPDC051575 TaxID=3154943 RepID=UPI0034461A1F
MDGHPAHAVDPERVRECFGRAVCRTRHGVVLVGDVVSALRAGGARVFVAGGPPRDWLTGDPARDVDLYVDRPVAHTEGVLRAAFAVDAVWQRVDGFGLLRWGDQGCLDISFLRSPDALTGAPLADTVFRPGRGLRADARMRDFTVNALYYDCALGRIVEPVPGSVADVRNRRLRIVSDPRKLAVDFRTSLRAAQFAGRGFRPVPDTVRYLRETADRDVLGVGAGLGAWVAEHVPDGGRAEFGAFLAGFLRTGEAQELLREAVAR